MSGFTDARVTSDEARHIAEETFLFGLPLVYMSVQAAVATSVENPDGSKAPFNQFAHFREFPDASNRQIVGLNVDTLYSLASLDLTSEPIVLSVPEMKNRWWLMQLLDAWNDVPGAPGDSHGRQRRWELCPGRPELRRPAASRAHRVPYRHQLVHDRGAHIHGREGRLRRRSMPSRTSTG